MPSSLGWNLVVYNIYNLKSRPFDCELDGLKVVVSVIISRPNGKLQKAGPWVGVITGINSPNIDVASVAVLW